MVEKSVILKTIKKMLNSGISESVIKSTLKEVGVSEEEVNELLAEAKSEKKPVIEKRVLKEVDKESMEREAQELRETTTHLKMEEHSAALEELNEKMDSIQRRLSVMASKEFDGSELNEKMDSINLSLKEIKKELSEMKSLSSALHSLLKKVLETDREVLTDLKKKS
jgi:uncharacterized protein YukE